MNWKTRKKNISIFFFCNRFKCDFMCHDVTNENHRQLSFHKKLPIKSQPRSKPYIICVCAQWIFTFGDDRTRDMWFKVVVIVLRFILIVSIPFSLVCTEAFRESFHNFHSFNWIENFHYFLCDFIYNKLKFRNNR